MSTWDALLDALQGIPDLRRGLCVGDGTIWDQAAQDPAAAEKAIALCRQCVELDKCREWLHGLRPSQRPPGVCAGELNTWAPRTRKKAPHDRRHPRRPPGPLPKPAHRPR